MHRFVLNVVKVNFEDSTTAIAALAPILEVFLAVSFIVTANTAYVSAR